MNTSNTWIDLRAVALLIAVALQVSCGTEEPAAIRFVADLAGDDSTALFRGHDMGDDPLSVRNTETWTSTFDTDTVMEYVHSLKLDSSAVEIVSYYTFDDFGLFEMQFDLFPSHVEAVNRIRPELADYLTERFGRADSLGISMRWTTAGPSNSTVEIILSDETADFGRPFLSLNFYESIGEEI